MRKLTMKLILNSVRFLFLNKIMSRPLQLGKDMSVLIFGMANVHLPLRISTGVVCHRRFLSQ